MDVQDNDTKGVRNRFEIARYYEKTSCSPQHARRERTRLVVLDVDYEGDELFVGRVFKNRDDCKVKIAVHAINRKFSYRNDRTSNVRCVSDTCPWRVYCIRLEETEYFELRTAMLVHNCPVEVRSQYQRQATTSVISQVMKNKYAGAGVATIIHARNSTQFMLP
ncbi:Transposase MuDR plant [Arabidopsis thaliana x Arabidopsis arenosa]|uniref:Transposase MuDR plant n=1 Tax=Arabidopsis thaliana x Arabidopsis arenosa TaxID=1240361 RepID=A0A8T1XIX1_9BRAS|nr:Transposase MuDR plant [Arabidopsis thaliana x Arabidopsis arenosa]